MKTKTKTTAYIVHSIAAVVLLLIVQISLAGSATWLSSPLDSAWENPNNWTPGGPPNGPSDIATFAQSSQTGVNISTSEEVNSIVFISGSAFLSVSPFRVGQLILSGPGVINNNGVSQSFAAANGGQIIFNNASTAASAHVSIHTEGVSHPPAIQSSTIRRVRPALRLRTGPKTSLEMAPVGKQSSTAHRLRPAP